MASLPSQNNLRRRLLAAAVSFALVCIATVVALCDETSEAVRIDTRFAGGNARVTINEGDTVCVEPDLRGGRPWFYWCFKATSLKPGLVNFVLPEKVAGFKDGGIGYQGPAFSTDSGKTWKWMGVAAVKHNAFSYEFRKANESVRFAVTIPYVAADLHAFLERNAKNPHLKQTVLTKSRDGREVELLRIGTPGPRVKPMLVTGRHHAAETIASFVLEGFLQEAMSDSAAAKEFRKNYLLYAVPLVDKDGVEEGDQGKNRKPHDHNRDYGENSIYPEIRAIKELDKEQDFRFALDFHCPTLVMKDHQVMYFVGAKNHPKYNFENTSELASWIKKGLPKNAPAGPFVWLRSADRPTPMNSHYFGFKEKSILAATLEIPFAPPGKAANPSSCRKYGKIILQAWVNAHFVAAEKTGAGAKPDSEKPMTQDKNVSQGAVARSDLQWRPAQSISGGRPADRMDELVAPKITITATPKPTADDSKYTRDYVIELKRFNISNENSHPVETSKGINAALQHAKSINANRILFPKGTYRISETDPILIDHRDTIIDLNGATLQINANANQRYSIVNFVDGASNVRLTNGTLRGDRDEHDFSSNNGVHEWGHGLVFDSGRNLEVDHLTLTNMTGDGANSRFTGARNRRELLARIMHTIYKKHLEPGGFSKLGQKIKSKEKTRSIEPFDVTDCGGQFEFGYSTGYLGFPFIRGRVFQAYFFDHQMKFIATKKCVQFRKVRIPQAGKFVHLEFNQAEVPDEPFHAGAGTGSFVGRISNFKGPVDVHFHHNNLVGNRRLGMGYCGGRRWLIEDNLFARNGGTAPGYGIDLEDGWEFMMDVVIRNNRFEGNHRGDLVICAGSELLIEGNRFQNNVTVQGRPHNYTFRRNHFGGGRVGYKTRTGVARIHDNSYQNCSLSIEFDSKAVADGINRKPGQYVPTPPLKLEDETLLDVKSVTGTYFDLTRARISNARFIAGEMTSLVRFVKCRSEGATIRYEANGPSVLVDSDESLDAVKQEGPGLNRRASR